MKKVWSDAAWDDYLFWQQNDKAMLRKVNELIRDADRHPFSGIGKPEPLKEQLSGWWSRRISGEHRLVYRVVGSGDAQALEIASCRYRY
ncbi:Txe/YoeB family addiction module toxin [Azospirillum sp. TSO35-2]|uniref:Txe/YoeB family addiction module toxin n=1 Tax=Azospirillum sp. TSO35-2 TaxID=716796 RepID=UPI000D61B74A|nr:Txe/YoeB family addiction module toxin [Azospirillum sp. TSO35-2]PWC34155.1 addiction module protein [Azospirillum sp. TSO35-2]